MSIDDTDDKTESSPAELEHQNDRDPAFDYTKLAKQHASPKTFLELGILALPLLSKYVDGRFAELRGRTEVSALWVKAVVAFFVVGAVVWLSLNDKLNSASATILGTLAGYLLGNRRD